MENLQSTLLELNKLAIFRMSLGSKELFHSNFLEYLWSIDPSHKMFVRIINKVLPKNKQLPLEINYEFSREKENFDICLYHEESFRDGKKRKRMLCMT